jgi:CSLREA domain-containing protein
LLLVALAPSADAATFDVTRTDDPAPDACQPSDCSLREAIRAANADPDTADEIILPAGTYSLTRSPGDDTASSGDLDITGSVQVDGDGAGLTVVRQTVTDRVFDIRQVQTATGPIQLRDLGVTGGDLGGLRTATVFTKLEIANSAIFGNQNMGNGGGLVLLDRAVGFPVAVRGSTISGNSAAGGAGIQVDDGVSMTLENSTVSGNTATGPSGGGGIRTDASNGSSPGTAALTHVTVAANAAPSGTGAGLRHDGTISVKNTIVSGNAGANCAGSGTTSEQGNNLENGTSCGLSINADPLLGPLADNTGDTQTHAIPANSPAVDAAVGCPPPATDQRGVDRPEGPACDIGAFEFVRSTTLPSVPDCSPTGQITLTMDPPAGEDPVAFKYKIDDGPTQTAQTDDGAEQISLPGEGRFKLEYWSQTTAGEEPEADHIVDTAIVDMTDPTVSAQSDQSKSIYVIKRNATVTVQAADGLSGLEVNPSAQRESVGTGARGTQTVEWTAQDRCENQATARFQYVVLGPGLGRRAVIEPLGNDVEVRVSSAAGARASQKGRAFTPLTQPREIPIRSTIDTRGGRARITNSRSRTEGDIQDGVFGSGIFQVLQSRRARAKGLTTLKLKGGRFTRCRARRAEAGAARLSRRAVRRLRAKAKGRYRTRGRHSAATVRGTKWTVTDRCDGTLTKVRRGKVAVRDFRLKRTIVLRRGKSYLAKARP